MTKVNLDSVTDYFPTANEGFITTVAAPGVTSGADTVTLTSVADLIDGSVFVGIIEPGNAAEQVFTGTVDKTGSKVSDVKWVRGNNADHQAGVSVVDYVTSAALNMMSAGFLKEHSQQGTHGDLSVSSLVSAGGVSGTSLSTAGSTTTGTFKATGKATFGAKTVPKVVSLDSATSLAINSDLGTIFACDALATNTSIAAPTGTPDDGQGLEIRLKDNGTARTISWNASFAPVGVTLPTTTTANKKIYVSARYNASSLSWDVLGVGRE